MTDNDHKLTPTPIDDGLLDDFGEPGPSALPEPPEGTVGYTHFDEPGSEDDQVTVLLGRRHLDSVVPGAMVRIDSPADPLGQGAHHREFQGVVIAGPYAGAGRPRCRVRPSRPPPRSGARPACCCPTTTAARRFR